MANPIANPVKLLQITDLHLKADPQAEMRGANIQEQVNAVFEAAQNHPLWPAHLVALTGDIADETETQAFRSVYQRLAEKLAPLNTRICCIPGNHDAPLLLQALESEYGIQSSGSLQLGNWQILLLDSSVPGQVAGELSPKQLALLEQQLNSPAAEHLLLLVHHPAVAIGCHWLDQIRLRNGQQLLEKLSAHAGSKLVIWGHAHQEFDQYYQEIRLLGTPAACPVQFQPNSLEFAVDEANSAGYRWCQLYEDGTISTQVERL